MIIIKWYHTVNTDNFHAFFFRFFFVIMKNQSALYDYHLLLAFHGKFTVEKKKLIRISDVYVDFIMRKKKQYYVFMNKPQGKYSFEIFIIKTS